MAARDFLKMSVAIPFLIILMGSLNAQAAPALPIVISVEEDVGPALRQQLPDLVRSGLGFVKMFSPRGYDNNFFEWTVGRENLVGKDIVIVITTSQDSTIAPILSKSDHGMDAFTMATVGTGNKMSIAVVLLADRLFFDSRGKERPDGYARLILALAHEIFGNVQSHLEFDIATAKPQTKEDRNKQERKAFRASLNFLAALRDHPQFLRLPDSVRQGLMGLMPAEIAAYRSWAHAHPAEGLDDSCEAMLNSLIK